MDRYIILNDFVLCNRWYRVGDPPQTFEEIPEEIRAVVIAERLLYESIVLDAPVSIMPQPVEAAPPAKPKTK